MEQPNRILDLGCGRGLNTYHFARFGVATGIDLSNQAISDAQARWPEIDFRCVDLRTSQIEGMFDIVVSSEVIEHIEDKKRFAELVAKTTRKDGRVIITTPNKRYFEEVVKSGGAMQPIEEWVSLGELQSVFSEYFEKELHETFFFQWRGKDKPGVLLDAALNPFLKRIRPLALRDFIRRKLNMGLYQIYVGRRK